MILSARDAVRDHLADATNMYNSGVRGRKLLSLLGPVKTYSWMLTDQEFERYRGMCQDTAQAISKGASGKDHVDDKDFDALVQFDPSASHNGAVISASASFELAPPGRKRKTPSQASEDMDAKMMRFFTHGAY